METNHQTDFRHVGLKEMPRFFTNCLYSLAKHWSKKVTKRNLVINLDYSFKILNQTFSMAQCVSKYVPDVLDVD